MLIILRENKMSTLVVVHPSCDGVWPYAANHFQVLWPDADFVRLVGQSYTQMARFQHCSLTSDLEFATRLL